MKRQLLHILVGLLTFTLGVTVHRYYEPHTTLLIVRKSKEVKQPTIQLSELSEDEVHLLYEAAAMSTNYSDISKGIYQKFWCVTSDGRFDGRERYIEGVEEFRCIRDDGTSYEFDSERFTRFREEHNRWQSRNALLIDSATGTPQQAKEYVEKSVDNVTLQPLPHYPYTEY